MLKCRRYVLNLYDGNLRSETGMQNAWVGLMSTKWWNSFWQYREMKNFFNATIKYVSGNRTKISLLLNIWGGYKCNSQQEQAIYPYM